MENNIYLIFQKQLKKGLTLVTLLGLFLFTGQAKAQTYASLPYSEGFENATFGAEWETTNTPGRTDIVSAGPGAKTGTYYMLLDEGPSTNGQATADLHVNISGACEPTLKFWWMHLGDEQDFEDGIFISVDGGQSFTKVYDLQPWTNQADDVWYYFELNILTLLNANNISVPADGKIIIRFSQQDTLDRYSEGFGWDDISITDDLTGSIKNDVGITSINSPKKGGSPYGLETLNVTLSNFSGSIISSGSVIPITYQTSLMSSPKTIKYTLQSDLDCRVLIDLDDINMACEGIHTISVWSSFDNNLSNDTTIGRFNNVLSADFTEDFENGTVGSNWTLRPNGGMIQISTNDNPRGNYHMVMSEGTGVTPDVSADWSVDLSGLTNPTLSFWVQAIGGPEGEAHDGVYLSTDGGKTFTKVVDLESMIDNGLLPDNQYVNIKFNIDSMLKAHNLPVVDKIIIRFGQVDTIASEKLSFDDIQIFDEVPAQKKRKPSNVGIFGNDTAYINSPATYTSKLLGGVYNKWLINGQVVSDGEGSIEAIFTQLGKDTLTLITAGCFGIDTTIKIIEIVQPTKKPTPDFVVSENIIDLLGEVTFTDLSTDGPQQWSWDISPKRSPIFFDAFIYINGTDSTSRKPEVLFLAPGFYSVCLIVSNSVGSDTLCRTNYVRVKNQKDICIESSTSDSMGFVFDGENGSYPANASCDFLIQPCASNITLDLWELDLKENEGFLQIYDGIDANGTPLWDISQYGSDGITGDSTHPGYRSTFKVTSGNVYVRFTSGSSPAGEGFSLEWDADLRTLQPIMASIEGESAVCTGSEAAFEATSNFANARFEWYFTKPRGQGPQSISNQITRTFSTQGNDTIFLITSHCNRKDTTVKVINSFIPTSPPNLEFTADRQFAQVGEVITLTDLTDDCITGRQWSFQPNTYQFVDGTGPGSEIAKVSFSSTGVYILSLVDTNSGGFVADTSVIGYITIQNYCEPQVQNLNSDIGISLVKISNLVNNSAIGNSGYTDYAPNTDRIILEQGETINITLGRKTNLNPINYRVWIDFNRDADFEDPGELIAKSGSINTSQWQGTIQVPTNRSGVFRMRVGANFGKQNNIPCGPNLYGEFEDYLVNVVEDGTPPNFVLFGGDTVTLQPCGNYSSIINQAYAMDNVDGRINNLTITQKIDSSNAGFYTVTYSATDVGGNTGTATQIFHILRDTTPPTFSIQGSGTMVLGVFNPFNDPGITQPVDDCSGIRTIQVINQIDNSLLGTYSVRYEVTDSAGNTTTLTRMVTVVDTIAPQFELRGTSPMLVEVNTPFNNPGIMNLSDNYYSNNELDSSLSGFVNTGSTGTYNLTYTVTDPSGNSRSLMRIVRVVDRTGPVVTTVEGNDTFVLDVNTTLNFQNRVIVTDNYSTPALTDTAGNFYLNFPNGRATRIGNYTLTLTYSDNAGNMTSATFIVKVVDRIAPQIALRGPSYVTVPQWKETPYASPDSVIVTDNYHNPVNVDVEVSGSYFTDYINGDYRRGIYEIIYQAVDPSGNRSSTVTRIVDVTLSGIEENDGDVSIKIYPNPTTGAFNFEFELGSIQDYTIKLFSSTGKMIRSFNDSKEQGNYNIDISGLNKGIYFIRLETEKNVITKRIILQ